MIFYSEKNVYEAGKDRIRWIFDEFPDRKIVVGFSGGKDSTVVLNLCHEVMQERGIEKIPVFFCDQEAEAPQTIEYVREVMNYDWVEPYWIQSYFQEWNSSLGDWFNVWGEGEEWCREKEPNNPYTNCKYDKTKHFKEVLDSMLRYHFGDDYVCLGGVRTEESPARRGALTNGAFYKDITWGKQASKKGLVFYPIWDWCINDVWYYIFSNNISYCKLYNYLFTQKPLRLCRVSSYIHENAIQDLKYIREISPNFYARILKRVENVNTTVQSYSSLCRYVESLPPYFESWDEYVYYLIDNLIHVEKNKITMKKTYDGHVRRWMERFKGFEEGEKYVQEVLGHTAAVCVVAEDIEMSKIQNKIPQIIGYYKEHKDEIERANKESI